MKKYWFITMAGLILLSCSGNTEKKDTTGESHEPTTDSFFPVTSFIKGQMLIIDSLPITPLQITSVKEKADSVWITKKELKGRLQTFMTPEIKETNFIKYFKETKFKDQTLNSITFTYDPINLLPSFIPLRHWDVYIDPETGNVKKVYIVKNIKEQDRVITQQLTWQSGKFAKISSFSNNPDGTMELLKEMVFVWQFS